MLSFFLITMAIATILPIFLFIYQERNTIRQQEEIALYLEQETHRYLVGEDSKPFESFVIEYEGKVLEQEVYRACAEWIADNQREYETCLYAKR